MAHGGVTNATLRSKQPATTTAATRAYSCRLLLLGGWTAAGRQDRSVVLCAKRGKEACTLYEEKSPVCVQTFQTLRTYAGRGDAETQSPGMFWKPGDLPQVCPRPKKFKRLAMRDTQHGSRPNLQQREPDGQIVPTPPDVWDKGASTKRCARRKKKNHNYTCTYYT